MTKKVLLPAALFIASIMIVVAIWVLRDSTLLLMMSQPEKLGELRKNTGELTPEKAYRGAAKLGTEFLLHRQKDNFSWCDHPGITALCSEALLKSGQLTEGQLKSKVRPALSYLADLQNADGSVAVPFSPSTMMKNYTTSLAVLAWSADPSGDWKKNIEAANTYLSSAQITEENSESYGGWGYGAGGKADLSNMAFALEALQASDSGNSEALERARAFLAKCQQSEATDEQNASGGFGYRPPDDGQSLSPYGAMSFAGLKSLILANADKDSKEVKKVLDWISKNYSVESHPGRGDVGLFYYYATMAKALSLAGINELTVNGETVNWRADLRDELIRRQHVGGGWVNSEKKYMEGIPELASAYALIALSRTAP